MKLITKLFTLTILFGLSTQVSALYCGSATVAEHESAGRAYSQSSYSWWYTTTNYYATGSGESISGTVILQETSADYYEEVSACGNTTAMDQPTTVEVGPAKTADNNPSNRLDEIGTFSGKNYNVAIAGSDLVSDTNGDHQANVLNLPRSVSVNIPEGATVEAAYISYYGSAYLTEGGGEDDTDDTVSGGELPIDSEADIENNEINITINNNEYNAMTPATAGGNSRSKISWWKMYAAAGTLEDSRIAFYNNRLDVTDKFAGLSGNIPVAVTRLQRADFTGATSSRMEYFFGPSGYNGNGDKANDCLANASFSVIVIYSLPAGESKTITVYDGVSWAWNNDFATDSSKAHSPISNPLALDINMTHQPVNAASGLNVYIGALDGDQFGHSGVPQCGSSSYPHDTGYDHTWISSGNAQEEYFTNIYEGDAAPEDGQQFSQYPGVTSIAKGLNYNVVKVALANVEDGATQTKIHVEGDNPISTTKEQEAMLISFAIVEGVEQQSAGGGEEGVAEGVAEEGIEEEGQAEEAENQIPQITLNGDSEIVVAFGETFTDPGASATDPEDGVLEVTADCPVNNMISGSYLCTYVASDSDGESVSVTRVVIVEEEIVQPSCTEYTATNSSHKTAGRAYSESSGYWWYSSTYYYANGSGNYLGSSSTTTTLKTIDGVTFEEGSCP